MSRQLDAALGVGHVVAVAWKRHRRHLREEVRARLHGLQDAVGDGVRSIPVASDGIDGLLLAESGRLTHDPPTRLHLDVYPPLAPEGVEVSSLGPGDERRTQVIPPYVGVRWDPDAGDLEVWNDYAGVGRVYHAETPEMVVVSTRIRLLQTVTAGFTDLDETSLSVYAAIGWYTGTRTPFSGVHLLEANGSVRLRDAGRRTASAMIRSGTPVRRRTGQELSIADVRDEMVSVARSIARVTGGRNLSLGLSGGRDSRLVAVLLSAAGVPFSGHTIDKFPRETAVTREVARIVNPGDDLVVRAPPSPRKPGDLDDSARRLVAMHEGMYDSTYVGHQTPETTLLPGRARNPAVGGAGGELAHGYNYHLMTLDLLLSMDRAAALNHLFRRVTSLRTVTLDGSEVLLGDLGRLADEAEEHGFRGAKLLDWFYLRERLRRWSGLSVVNRWTLAPLTGLAFANAGLGQGVEATRESALHRDLIAALRPELADIPFFKPGPDDVVARRREPLTVDASVRERLLADERLPDVMYVDTVRTALAAEETRTATPAQEEAVRRALWITTTFDYADDLRQALRRPDRSRLRTAIGRLTRA